jgi:two-component system response regulator FixJ
MLDFRPGLRDRSLRTLGAMNANPTAAEGVANRPVHVVDDDAVIRQNLARMLARAGFGCIGHASAEAFLQRKDAAAPALLVLDVRLPGMSGLDLMRLVRAEGLKCPVLVMSGQADIPLAVEAMKRGARDFLQKPFRRESLLEAIHAALAVESASEGEPEGAFGDLSPRQREVLAGVVAGQTNKEIAHTLSLSVRTVEAYRAEIMTRIGARTSGELIRRAVQSGY